MGRIDHPAALLQHPERLHDFLPAVHGDYQNHGGSRLHGHIQLIGHHHPCAGEGVFRVVHILLFRLGQRPGQILRISIRVMHDEGRLRAKGRSVQRHGLGAASVKVQIWNNTRHASTPSLIGS